MYFLLFIFFLIILFCFSFPIKENLNCLDLAIEPNYSSNYRLGQLDETLYLNPDRDLSLRGYKRFERDRIYDDYFDSYDINCTENKYSGFKCNLIKGNYVNTIPNKYCKKICPKMYKENIEKFTNQLPKNKKTYWCFNSNAKKCQEKNYNYLEPYKNTCGESWISQDPLPVYPSEKSCMNDNFICNALKTKKECLKNSSCGWCMNSLGQGNCLPSTPEGTLDITLPCFPNRGRDSSGFLPGYPNPFKGIMQKY